MADIEDLVLEDSEVLAGAELESSPKRMQTQRVDHALLLPKPRRRQQRRADAESEGHTLGPCAAEAPRLATQA
jgi:hypothetical protein